MRYYKYNIDYFYMGFVDSDTPVMGATTIAPQDDNHNIWNPDLQVWELLSPPALTLDEEKLEAIHMVREFFEDVMETAKSNIANFEEETYRTQENEWRLWQEDNTALTPYIDILCYRRQVTKEFLMGRIGMNISFFADIQGQMHALEDVVGACQTSEELAQIPFPWL